MKGRMHKLWAAGLVVLGTLGIGVGIALAGTDSATASGTSESTIYKVGRTVSVSGTVNGDVFCAGQTVTVNATVNGDVLCAGQTVTVNGTVHGSVRLAGQTVTLGATVDRNASVAGQDVTLDSNSKVQGDVSVAGQTATLNGSVGRDVHGSSNTIVVSGPVGRDVWANVNRLRLQNGASIAGNVDYTSPNTLVKSGGTIRGSVSYHVTEVHHRNWSMWHGAALAFRLYWMVSLLVLSVVLAALFPQVFRRWNKVAWTRPWAALLTGFIAMFALPVLMVALFISLVGVPLGLLTLLFWFGASILTAPIAAYYVGSLVFQQAKRSPVLVILVGSVVLAFVTLVPILGALVTIAAYWLGLGTLLLNLRSQYKKPNYKTT